MILALKIATGERIKISSSISKILTCLSVTFLPIEGVCSHRGLMVRVQGQAHEK
jgi:hypothetical protein